MHVTTSCDKDLSRESGVAPVVLAILDGWGHRDSETHNAIRHASTPVMDALWHAYPHSLIQASGATWVCLMSRWAIQRWGI